MLQMLTEEGAVRTAGSAAAIHAEADRYDMILNPFDPSDREKLIASTTACRNHFVYDLGRPPSERLSLYRLWRRSLHFQREANAAFGRGRFVAISVFHTVTRPGSGFLERHTFPTFIDINRTHNSNSLLV